MILSLMIKQNIIEALGWTIIHSIWQISLIAILLALISNHFPVKKAENRYYAGLFSMLAIVLFSVMTFCYYFINAESFISQSQDLISHSTPNIEKSMEGNIFNSIFSWLKNNLSLITIIWILGFLFFALKNAGALIYLSFLQKRSSRVSDSKLNWIFGGLLEKSNINFPVELKISDKINSPLTFGVFKSIILLPLAQINHLSIDETEAILAHEIAHIVRKDFIVNLFLTFVGTLFYYHPAIWWIKYYIELEREKSTDAFAMQISKSNPVDYAKLLYNVQQMAIQARDCSKIKHKEYSFLSMPLIKRKKHLLCRIENILGKQEKRNPSNTRLLVILSMFIYLVLISFTDISLPNRQSHPALAKETQLHNEEQFTQKAESKEIERTDSITLEISSIIPEMEEKQLVKGVDLAPNRSNAELKPKVNRSEKEIEEVENKMEIKIIQRIDSKENKQFLSFFELEEQMKVLSEEHLAELKRHKKKEQEWEVYLDFEHYLEHMYHEKNYDEFFRFRSSPEKLDKMQELSNESLKHFKIAHKHYMPGKEILDSNVIRVSQKIMKFEDFDNEWFQKNNDLYRKASLPEILDYETLIIDGRDKFFPIKGYPEIENGPSIFHLDAMEDEIIEKVFILSSSLPVQMHVISEITVE